ncbi:hypothetical protein TNCV_4814181 [Trichonephila clavipes]|nr:hypothetical protein TNCV_4814181 [Trichonephila clavipes]
MFDSSSYDNLTPLAHADASRNVLPRGGEAFRALRDQTQDACKVIDPDFKTDNQGRLKAWINWPRASSRSRLK